MRSAVGAVSRVGIISVRSRLGITLRFAIIIFSRNYDIFSRDDITMFAIKNGIVWREDRSNATIKYIRNKVRHKILPVLKEINP